MIQLPIQLPKELEPFSEKILKLAKPCLRIKASAKENIGLTDSKFGGFPYLPKGVEFPKDENGKYMLLAAQINFAQVSKFQNYPEKGLLQFFVALDSAYGLELGEKDRQQINWKVQYFEDFDETNATTDFTKVIQEKKELIENGYDWYDPYFNNTFALEFYSSYSFPCGQSKTYQTIVAPLEDTFYDSLPEDSEIRYFSDFYEEKLIGKIKHQIGGHPYFVQNDLVDNMFDQSEIPGWLTLLQIDSQSTNSEGLNWEILIGDCGNFNFFITEEDLIKKDFNKVLYECQYS